MLEAVLCVIAQFRGSRRLVVGSVVGTRVLWWLTRVLLVCRHLIVMAGVGAMVSAFVALPPDFALQAAAAASMMSIVGFLVVGGAPAIACIAAAVAALSQRYTPPPFFGK